MIHRLLCFFGWHKPLAFDDPWVYCPLCKRVLWKKVKRRGYG
jgi:hypothetical protein